MLQKYADEDINEDPDIWKKVIVRNQIKVVKNLAIASRKFFKYYQKRKHWSPVHIVAFFGDLQLCMQIFEKLKMKDPRNRNGISPFHNAALGGNTEIYRYLMKDVKEINPADNYGRTPLHVASQKGHLEICKLIIDNVDDMSPVDNNGSLLAQNGFLGIFTFIYQLFF